METFRASDLTHVETQGGKQTCRSHTQVIGKAKISEFSLLFRPQLPRATSWRCWELTVKCGANLFAPLPYVVYIYHLLMCYNWCGHESWWFWWSWLSYCLLSRKMKNFPGMEKCISHEMQSMVQFKVKNHIWHIQEGHKHYFCAHKITQITWVFKAEKNTPAKLATRNNLPASAAESLQFPEIQHNPIAGPSPTEWSSETKSSPPYVRNSMAQASSLKCQHTYLHISLYSTTQSEIFCVRALWIWENHIKAENGP